MSTGLLNFHSSGDYTTHNYTLITLHGKWHYTCHCTRAIYTMSLLSQYTYVNTHVPTCLYYVMEWSSYFDTSYLTFTQIYSAHIAFTYDPHCFNFLTWSCHYCFSVHSIFIKHDELVTSSDKHCQSQHKMSFIKTSASFACKSILRQWRVGRCPVNLFPVWDAHNGICCCVF